LKSSKEKKKEVGFPAASVRPKNGLSEKGGVRRNLGQFENSRGRGGGYLEARGLQNLGKDGKGKKKKPNSNLVCIPLKFRGER